MAKRILVADDSVTIQKVVELSFMEEDFEVQVVSNGDEALRAFSETAADLVIADVHMPGADGYAVARSIKEGSPSTPVILLVGTFEHQDHEQAKVADAVLNKPFDSQELLGLAKRLLVAAPETGKPVPAAEPAAAEPAAGATEPAGGASPAAAATATDLSPETIEAIARRVAELIGPDLVREVAWEVVPDLAEVVIRDRLSELESQVE